MGNGRLETQIITVGWTGTIDVGGGAQAWAIADDDYFETELLAALAAALTLAAGEGITVTGSFGENGTGQVTIDRTAAGTMTVVFTNTDHRAFLGFTGALTGANNYTGSSPCSGVWLPDCPINEKFGPQDEGHYLITVKQTGNTSGYRRTLVLGGSQVINSVWWSHVSRARARRAFESTAMSFERWMYEGQLGGYALFQPGAPVNLYFDAGDSAKFTYSLDLNGTTDMQRTQEDWSGLFRIELSGVRTPGT